MSADPRWARASRILCVRLDSMGDVLMTTPAMRALKESIPGASITLLTSPAGLEPARSIPEVSGVICYESPWMKASPPRENNRYDLGMVARLKEERFDAAVIFTVYSQSPLPAAMLCTLAEIPLRLAHCRENPYHLLTDWVKESEPHQHIRHEVQRQLDLAAAVGCETADTRLSFRVTEDSRRRAAHKLTAAGIDLAHPWIVLHPGVSAPSRQYAPEGYAQAIAELAQVDGLQVLLTGSASEIPLVDRIIGAAGIHAASLAGQLKLAELAAVLQMARLLIANNTGPVHLAAAVGTPVVDLYALTNPQHTPWGVASRVLNHDVPCKFCYKSVCPEGHHNCLALVTPAQVADAARGLLAETSQ